MVSDMSFMFYNCNNLKYLNLLSFDTKNVNDMIVIALESAIKL